MTTHPSIPTPEATPERAAMTDERIEQLKTACQRVRDGSLSLFDDMWTGDMLDCISTITRLRAVIAERDATIARDRAWIRHIAMLAAREPSRLDGPEHNLYDAIEAALAGEEAPDGE